jgi:hemolysin-activating ACP:hemolysin acyltransferase
MSQPASDKARPATLQGQLAGRPADALFRSAAFGEAVSILMRAPKHRTLPLSALGHHVLPAIVHNQFRIARIRRSGNTQAAPAGFAMWGNVSDAVDARLRSAPLQPIRLKFEEWQSGANLWLVDLIAPATIASDMLKEIDEKIGKGRPVSTLIAARDGTLQVTTITDLLRDLKKSAA